MSYNILNKNVNFQGPVQGTIEDIVDTHSNQSITGSKDFQTLTGSNVYVKSKIGVGLDSPTYTVDIVPADSSALRIKNSSNGVDVNCGIENAGTDAGDDALLSITTQDASGDPSIRFAIAGNETYAIGIDNSDGDKFKISQHSTLHTDTRLTIQGGNVGIGTDTPSTKLEVNGNMKCSGITATGTISGSGPISGSAFYGDGSKLTGVSTSAISNLGLTSSASGIGVDITNATAMTASLDRDNDLLLFHDNGVGLRKTALKNVANLFNPVVSVFTGQTQHRVVTVDGAETISGEGNLTFDGSTLTITGDVSGSQVVSGNIGHFVTKVEAGAIALSNAAGIAGAGLVNNSGVLDIQVSGAVKLASDKVGISGSIAGNGLTFAGGADSISSMAVQLQSNSGLAVAASGLKLSMNGLATATPAAASDSIAFIDSDGDKKCSFSTFLTAIAGANLGVSGSQLTASAPTTDIDALSALGGTGLHQTQDHFMFSDNGTEKKITFSNLEDAIFANVSGDATIAAGGALTIAANAVQDGMVNDDVATGLAGDGLGASSGVLAVQVSGAVKITSDKVGITGSIAGDGLTYAGGVNSISSLAVQVSGAVKIASDKVGISGSIAGDGLAFAGGVNSISGLSVSVDDSTIEINSDSLRLKDNGVTLAKMAGLARGKIIVGDSSGDPSALALGSAGQLLVSDGDDILYRTLGGDASLGADGTLTIAANAVEGSMLNSNVAGAGLDYGSNELSVDVSDFLANGSDNRIVTAVNADSMNAEANFTFDGTTLMLTGSTIFSGSATTFNTAEFVIQSATSEKPTIELKNTTPSDSNAGVLMNFFKQPSDNVGESDNNTLGGIKFLGLDSGNNSTTYGQMTVHSSDKSGGDEGGEFRFYVMAGGTGGTATLSEIFSIGGEDVGSSGAEPCEVVINEAGIDCNFRIESDTNTRAFYFDGTNGHVGIGDTADSGALLTLSGSNDELLFEAKQQGNGYPTMFLAGESHGTYPGIFYNRGKFVNGGTISQGNLEGANGSHTRLTVRKTSISDNSATDVVTITVPNANHAAAIRVFGLANFDGCSYAQSFSFEGSIARASGSPTDKAFSSVTTTENASITPNFSIAVGGSSNTGANSATQTFTLQFTINTSDSSSSNATFMIELINFNDSGITMAAS